MPFGGFLDDVPKALLIGAHVVLPLIGLWAWKRVNDAKAPYAPALWLYIASQPVFIAHFLDVITIRMTILTEQTLLVIMVAWIALKAGSAAKQ